MPQARFIEQRARHRTKAVRGHFVAVVPEPPQRVVEIIFTDRLPPIVQGREEIVAGIIERTELTKQCEALGR